MDNYGSNFKGPIKIESVATLPSFTTEAADERRVIYAEDTQKVYYASATAWTPFGGASAVYFGPTTFSYDSTNTGSDGGTARPRETCFCIKWIG